MIKTSLILFTFLPIVLFGQETKKITKEYKNPWFKEVYYVLKSNNEIRQGSYKKLGFKDEVLINGFYENGLKDSIWIEYYWGGKNTRSIGSYLEDKRVGQWEFYNNKGELEQKYDYTINDIVYFKLTDVEKTQEYAICLGMDTIKAILDQPPLYIGGSGSLYKSIWESIRYPDLAAQNGISGKVYVSFTIDTQGKTSNHKVTSGIGSGCDEEALKVVKQIPDNWIPGIFNGQEVNVEYIMPISFVLQ